MSSSDLTVMTQADLAAMRADEGMTVVRRGDRYWSAIFPGFYQPVHLLARLRAEDVQRPAKFCWGYRAALEESDAQRANGSMPVHLLAGVERFDERMMARLRRRDLRKCRGNVELIRLQDPSLIREQGYRVFRSAQDRVRYWPEMTNLQYRQRANLRVQDARRLFVAGLVDGKLGGYMESFAVDGVLYTHELIVATDAMHTGIGTGLYVETIEIAMRAGTVRDVCLGLDTPERPGLTEFKESLGFPVVHVPARSAIPAPISAYIRARRPAAYYRLTGLRQAEG